jgi:hypothetical protein
VRQLRQTRSKKERGPRTKLKVRKSKWRGFPHFPPAFSDRETRLDWGCPGSPIASTAHRETTAITVFTRGV